jgi:hypothetical protein
MTPRAERKPCSGWGRLFIKASMKAAVSGPFFCAQATILPGVHSR